MIAAWWWMALALAAPLKVGGESVVQAPTQQRAGQSGAKAKGKATTKGTKKAKKVKVTAFVDSVPSPSPSPALLAVLEQLTASLVIQVDDRAEAQKKAIEASEGLGGWFSALSTGGVTLRVPTGKVDSLVERLRSLGLVVDRTVYRSELGPQMADLRSAIAARREVLKRYYEVLDIAGPESVVAVEGEINRVIVEIESHEGTLRMLTDRGQFARVDVSFQWRDRQAPAPSGASNFGWLNEVDLGLLLADFRGGIVRGRVKGTDAQIPTAFASFKEGRAVAAVSPDDVMYRVRTTKNKPRADLAFWSEALRTRLVDAGYKLLDQGEIAATGEFGGASGRFIELLAPDGERDARWLIAIFVHGGQITVFEAAGEAGRFLRRRDAVVAAIQASKI